MKDKQFWKNYKKPLLGIALLLAAVLCIQSLNRTGAFHSNSNAPAGEKQEQSAAAAGQTSVPEETNEGGTAPESGTDIAAGSGTDADAAAISATGDGTESGTDTAAASGTGAAAAPGSGAEAAASDSSEAPSGNLFRDDYELEQVVVFSRHNIRSPFSGPGSLLFRSTPHEWYSWNLNPGELSPRGSTLETKMGQYFRGWLEAQDFFSGNYQPGDGEIRIYANSMQRTIATARFFADGLLPDSETTVEYHMEYNQMDPVFTPQLTFLTDSYEEDVRAQMQDLFEEKIKNTKDNMDLVSDVIDLEESEAWKTGEVSELEPEDAEFYYVNYDEPRVSGSLNRATSISDALILQYYEEGDGKKAAFGKDLSREQWEAIGEIKDVYQYSLFTPPLIAPNVAHPLLQEIRSELDVPGRKFTFLCGHDSNIASILAAIGTEEYNLPGTIEKSAPIGGKVVFCRWRAADGSEKMSVDLVYATTDQMCGITPIDPENAPAVFSVPLRGLEQDSDGMYDAQDVLDRLDQAIRDYDDLIEKYEDSEMDELDNAA